ncbi:MAG: hypothetical protein ACPHO3_11840, partial [Paracoccaceae bacterium]
WVTFSLSAARTKLPVSRIAKKVCKEVRFMSSVKLQNSAIYKYKYHFFEYLIGLPGPSVHANGVSWVIKISKDVLRSCFCQWCFWGG